MSGFTKWDLLMLVAIIGMLLGLLFPAINSPRGPHPRGNCMNNQSQLALALINYDSAQNQLPGWRQKFENGREVPWLVPLFPYLELNEPYRLLTAEPEEGKELPPPPDFGLYGMFRCGSAQVAKGSISFIANCGKMDAEFSAVASDNPRGHVPDAEPKNGVFFDLVETETKWSIDRISHVKGMSFSLFLSENLQPWYWNEPPRENLLGFCWPEPSFLNQQRAVCRGADAPVVPVFINLCKDGDSVIDHDRKPGLGEYRFSRPSSNHPGIVIVAFCDRSVRPINEKIDPKIFEKLMIVDNVEIRLDSF